MKFEVSKVEEELKAYLTYAMEYLGLKDFNIQVGLDHTTYERRFMIHFHKPVVIDPIKTDNTLEALQRDVIDPFRDSLQSSQAVKDAKEELNNQVSDLKVQVTRLQMEVERLKPYENHFKVEMKLRHGDDRDKDGPKRVS